MKLEFRKIIFSALILMITTTVPTALAGTGIELSKSQTIYVPVYSNVFSGPKVLPFNLAVMLSIRNVDIKNSITFISIDYYDNDGILLKKYLEKPLELKPLASNHIYIKESNESGGFGANFIVRWKSTNEINAPIIESIMIGARSGQGISFVSQGRVISENRE
ncbi:hypothetical protein DSOUD_1082 [Desulfuromonas soudanensis]|uniref:DUF3124 domain-containing protein n=1 Tax=Desulfuromonas soudanensis TaxID=1603606 RepID=A0A0M4CVQ5_9BACT|nr:DUF3124 domain-containing protein [Desulfuromonas soudanensis]ALC15866.1 hypothetical protein DSOUD_1082 [Desulfuromonas soudanensis]